MNVAIKERTDTLGKRQHCIVKYMYILDMSLPTCWLYIYTYEFEKQLKFIKRKIYNKPNTTN